MFRIPALLLLTLALFLPENGQAQDQPIVDEIVAVVADQILLRSEVNAIVAGVSRQQGLTYSDELWNECIASNLTGPFVVTRESLPLLRRGDSGVVINNASTLGLRPIAGSAAYCAAKAGMIRLTESTAIEEAPNGVRALAICPGVVDTPIHSSRSSDADRDQAAGFLEAAATMHPLGRVGQPKDVADLVLFLASDEASWMTGSVIPIDGGIALA